MWQRIKKFIFVDQRGELTREEISELYLASQNAPLDIKEYDDFTLMAIKRYCAVCDTFFKSNAGAAVHIKLKHKP